MDRRKVARTRTILPLFALGVAALVAVWLGQSATVRASVLPGLYLAWIGAGIFWSLSAPQTPRPASAMENDPQQAMQAIQSH